MNERYCAHRKLSLRSEIQDIGRRTTDEGRICSSRPAIQWTVALTKNMAYCTGREGEKNTNYGSVKPKNIPRILLPARLLLPRKRFQFSCGPGKTRRWFIASETTAWLILPVFFPKKRRQTPFSTLKSGTDFFEIERVLGVFFELASFLSRPASNPLSTNFYLTNPSGLI